MRIGAGSRTHTFDQLPSTNIPRSAFDLSHGYKTAFDSGYLVPIFHEVAYPGDTFNVKANLFARLSTPIVPFMDQVYMDTFFFAVPWRLVWTNFQKFMGEQANPADSTSYLIPQCPTPSGGYAVGSLQDYFGLPTAGQVTAGKTPSYNNLMLRAYNLIWNEWFRDENLQNSVVVDKDDGPDVYTDYSLLKRGKRKDYLTGALPWPQKNATSVALPLGTVAPVGNTAQNSINSNLWTIYSPSEFATGLASGITPGQPLGFDPDTTTTLQWRGNNWRGTKNAQLAAAQNIATIVTSGVLNGTPGNQAIGVPFGGLTADLSSATAATINQLRQAFQIQGMYERDARGGTRYTEIIRSHFGVVSDDARLQRPEYLAGNSSQIKVNPVVQTSNTPASGTPQGNLAAYAVGSSPSHGFVKSFTEHCLILGLVSIRAELSYQQGVRRMWTDQTRFDLFWPSFAHLGEQTVLNQEIYATGDAVDTSVFGYQERYAHLRYKPSMITGKLRSTAASTLDVWHLSQKFTALPTLGTTFIQEAPPFARVQAVTTEPQFIFDAWFNFRAVRPMPAYGQPSTLRF